LRETLLKSAFSSSVNVEFSKQNEKIPNLINEEKLGTGPGGPGGKGLGPVAGGGKKKERREEMGG
jgi:hypothetical protein